MRNFKVSNLLKRLSESVFRLIPSKGGIVTSDNRKANRYSFGRITPPLEGAGGRTNHGKKGYVNAFSLAEILIVLAIMGILIMLVVPNNAGVATRSKSLEAQQELKMIHTLQEAYRMQYSKYSMDMTQLNYIPHKLVTAGGTANYEVTVIEATTTGYKAKAEAVVDFNGDGKKNIWEIDQGGVVKEIQPD